VAHLADKFQNDIDNVNKSLEQFGNLKILGWVPTNEAEVRT
jgi:hypothetical protein